MPKPLEINGFTLKNSVMNGAGPVKTPKDVLKIAKSKSSAVIIGSITIKESGNKGKNYFSNNSYSLNSKGLPNSGLGYYKKHLPEMVRIAHQHEKPLIVSVAGFSPNEYAILSETVLGKGADGIELNLGCPNVWGKNGKQKRIACFDPNLTQEILKKVESKIGNNLWVSAKVSPYSDPSMLEKIAKVFAKSKLIKAVVTSNSFPNAFSFDKNKPAIEPSGGLAGLGGGALKPIGLGQVKQFRALLPERISIIGAGGISGKNDVNDYLRVGANAVQVTTACINLGPSIFARIGIN